MPQTSQRDSQVTPWIIKLGGSVISDKTTPFRAYTNNIKSLAKEIALLHHSFILLHGGGAFGHPLAKQYNLAQGYQDHTQINGIGLTHSAMIQLNQIVVKALAALDLPVMSFSPSSLAITNAGRIEEMNIQPIRKALKLGINPVLFGDIVFDLANQFAILSGDQLLSYLAKQFHSSRVFIGTDTDGIFTEEPKQNQSAKLIPNVSSNNIDTIFSGITDSTKIDVTGGMRGKLLELLEIADPKREIIIFNAQVPGRLTQLVHHEDVPCTRIIWG